MILGVVQVDMLSFKNQLLTPSIREFAASISHDTYWTFIESYDRAIRSYEAYRITDLEDYKLSIESSQQYLTKEKQSLLNMSLSYDYYLPRLKVFRDLGIQTLEKSGLNPQFNHSSWVAYGDLILTSYKDIESAIKSSIGSTPKGSIQEIIELDHVLPLHNRNHNVVVFYSTPQSPEFNAIHTLLKNLANAGSIQYVLRPWHVIQDPNERSKLQGYGIELALKNVEYKVRDDKERSEDEPNSKKKIVTEDVVKDDEVIGGFLFGNLIQSFPQYEQELKDFKTNLINRESGYENMRPWEIEELGVKASYHILNSNDPLKSLRDVSHNLPFVASLISRERMINETIVKHLERHTDMDKNYLYINQKRVDVSRFDLFQLYDLLYEEIFVYDNLKNIDLVESSARHVIKASRPSSSKFHLDLHSPYVLFLNDLEKDLRYRQWPSKLSSIMDSAHPFPPVRKNAITMISVIDLSSQQGMGLLEMSLNLFFKSLPLRVGYLFVNDATSVETGRLDRNSISSMCLRQINEFKPNNMIHFIREIYRTDNVNELIAACEYFSGVDLKTIFAKQGPWLKMMSDHLEKKGLGKPGQNAVFVNGELITDLSNYNIFTTIESHYAYIKEHAKALEHEKSLYDFLLTRQNVYEQYDDLIFGSSSVYVPLLDSQKQEAMKSVPYLPVQKDSMAPYQGTHWLAGSLKTEDSRKVASSFVQYVLSNKSVPIRVGWVHNRRITQSEWKDDNSEVLMRSIQTILTHPTHERIDHSLVWNTILELLKSPSLSYPMARRIAESFDQFETIYRSYELLNAMNLQSILVESLPPSNEVTLVSNGRILSLDSDQASRFTVARVQHLVDYELKNLKSLIDSMQWLEFTSSPSIESLSDIHMTLSSLIFSRKEDYPRALFQDAFQYNFGSLIHISLALNPLSPDAQRISSMLLSIRHAFPVEFSVVLSPQSAITNFPLKNFYRYSIHDLQFDAQGKRTVQPLVFDTLPQQKLLSMNIHPPEPWMVEPVDCAYDLDNILLDDLSEDVEAVFELEHILIEGSCYDLRTGEPTQGLQLQLRNLISGTSEGTLVMANLGYFQLKAAPGIYKLEVGEGRSKDLYSLVNLEDTIIVSSFSGLHLDLKAQRNPGKEYESLLELEESQDTWSSIKSLFVKKQEDETIHIFSVASGHLYERFLRMMMLSVSQHTKSPVKFWIIKNFLSPSFKNTIQRMVDHFGFQVEFVQYKWPSWLRHQTEKQRIIWGYKILFIDVLFPLDLKRIIYIDTDQIVRADVKELYNMDLHGAPYGFTPFCQGSIKRKETEQFRFWEGGFWKEHLGKKPYHISALFVIDLQRFRRMGAGDRLRAAYDQLSNDPNSLANLDQDLPNFLQHSLPIYSLPKEWLWCETWCTDASKKEAKTIDLCNNPLTKAPKLENALRIIEEWASMDQEIKNVIEKENKEDPRASEDANIKDEL